MPQPYYCERPDLGLIRVTGSDARTFLHAQTTQEINDLASSETRLAAWLSAKGRVRALFDVVPCNRGFWLITQTDNVNSLAQQLGLFVLRSAVELAVATDSVVYSCCGNIDRWLAGMGLDLQTGAVIDHSNLRLEGEKVVEHPPSKVIIDATIKGPKDLFKKATIPLTENVKKILNMNKENSSS